MTEYPVFECDVTGDRFGALNDVVPLDVKRRSSRNPFTVHEFTAHVSIEACTDHDQRVGELQHLDYVAVEDREILGVGVSGPDEPTQYFPRDHVVVDHHEPLFNFIETEVL